jgi:hypothetical protein
MLLLDSPIPVATLLADVVLHATIGVTDDLTVVTTGQMVAVISGMTAHLVMGVVVDERLQEGGRGRGRGRKRTTPWVDVTCQICGREGHPAKDCWYRFTDDDTESYEEKEAHVASYGVDTNWYSNTGATHHITGELNNLTMRDSYHGNDRVNTANGQGMEISHVGTSIVHNPVQNFYLRDILHVPTATRNLLSVHRFTLDNRVFIEFHPFYFLIKDQVTGKTLHRGRCVGGLYPFISSLVSSSSQKHAFAVTKP